MDSNHREATAADVMVREIQKCVMCAPASSGLAVARRARFSKLSFVGSLECLAPLQSQNFIVILYTVLYTT